MQLHGSYALLAAGPLWVTGVALLFLWLGVVLLIRKITEGRAYNPAVSSKYGIPLLIVIVLIGAYILHSPYASPPGFLATTAWQALVGVPAVVYALVRIFIYDNPADKYHQLVVMPSVLWFLLAIVPLIFERGSMVEFVWMILLLVTFVSLIVDDNFHERSQPRRYMMLVRRAKLKGNYPI